MHIICRQKEFVKVLKNKCIDEYIFFMFKVIYVCYLMYLATCGILFNFYCIRAGMKSSVLKKKIIKKDVLTDNDM